MQLCQVPGYFVHLGPLQPTLGIRPDQPYLDLRYGRDVGRGFFTDDFVVIACAGNGLIAVKVNHPEQNLIVGLDDQIAAHSTAYQLAGDETEEDYVCAELITRLAPDVYAFEAYLQPTPGGAA
jgi:hypothetical protein